ncbi:thioredoxin [Roseateles sp.]|uniref:thioredoxin n=1 Tax=Roseateles sp. TaxID=1971397 RepID=UPI002F3F1FC6
MSEPLNPWDHASEIARRLARPDAEFLTVIGASGWCSRCQVLQPRFEALSRGLPPHIVPLWLDLEEHAEFLGDFIPPDLPLLLRWRQGACVQAAIVEGIEPDAVASDRVQLRPLEFKGMRLQDPNVGTMLELPSLWREFRG